MAGEEDNTATKDNTAEDFDLIASLDVDTSGKSDDDTASNAGANGANEDADGKDAVSKDADSKDADGKDVDGKDTGSDEGDKDADPKWFESIEGSDLKKLASGYENRDELLTALGIESGVDWRASIKDPKLREHADRYTSLVDLVRGNVDLRQQISGALVPLGKNATRDERVAFATRLNKMLGVPEEPSGYSFPDPPEGEKLSEAEVTSRTTWAKFFHDTHVPKRMADAIVIKFNEEVADGKVVVAKQDEEFAEAGMVELRSDWGDDYDNNHTLAGRAVRELFGTDYETIMETTLANGKLLMDTPMMLRPMARIGKEMGEGGAELMSDTERETIDDQIRDLRKRAEDAKNSGETRLANKLFADEQNLLARIVGKSPIVGAGRSA